MLWKIAIIEINVIELECRIPAILVRVIPVRVTSVRMKIPVKEKDRNVCR